MLSAKEVTYEWKKTHLDGALGLRASEGNGYYIACQHYTLVGIWKKLEDGEVVDSSVTASKENTDNVCFFEAIAQPTQGVENGGQLCWSFPTLSYKGKLYSLRNGSHTFWDPKHKEDESIQQQAYDITISAPVTPPVGDPEEDLEVSPATPIGPSAPYGP
jgi:hypothetical protein